MENWNIKAKWEETNMSKEILMVKIHNAIHKDGKDLYEATQGNWKASQKRSNDVEYVIGIDKKKVVSAYKPIKWETVIENGVKRQRFEGEELDQTTFNLIKAREDELVKKFGRGSSIAYELLSNFEEVI